MRFYFLVLGPLISALMTVQDSALPDPQQLKQRALASMKESEKNLEKYSCIAHDQTEELNGDGTLKHLHAKEEEQFFVNGVEIDHTLANDGKQLSGNAARKEQQRVDAEVKKFSDPKEAEKSQVQDEKQVDMFLRAVRFTNGRRELRSGRSTIIYHLAADPSFHPKKLEERFAQALVGTIAMDEETGNVLELRVETDRDVKVGGGLLANVHKGFRFHLLQERQPDGVWLTTAMDGSGDARAGLLFHPRFRFTQRLDKCHLYSVDATQTLGQPLGTTPKPIKQ